MKLRSEIKLSFAGVKRHPRLSQGHHFWGSLWTCLLTGAHTPVSPIVWGFTRWPGASVFPSSGRQGIYFAEMCCFFRIQKDCIHPLGQGGGIGKHLYLADPTWHLLNSLILSASICVTWHFAVRESYYFVPHISDQDSRLPRCLSDCFSPLLLVCTYCFSFLLPIQHKLIRCISLNCIFH